jgi:hypothetical protein
MDRIDSSLHIDVGVPSWLRLDKVKLADAKSTYVAREPNSKLFIIRLQRLDKVKLTDAKSTYTTGEPTNIMTCLYETCRESKYSDS